MVGDGVKTNTSGQIKREDQMSEMSAKMKGQEHNFNLEIFYTNKSLEWKQLFLARITALLSR